MIVLKREKPISISAALLLFFFYIFSLGCQGGGGTAIGIGKAAPDFSLYALKKGRRLQPVRLSDYRGKVVLLRFWADFCPFCRVEMPILERFYRAFRELGLEVLAVNVGQSVEVVEAFSGELGLTYIMPLDPEGEVAKKYMIPGLPTTFIIDRQGIIKEMIIGEMDEKMLRSSLYPYLETATG